MTHRLFSMLVVWSIAAIFLLCTIFTNVTILATGYTAPAWVFYAQGFFPPVMLIIALPAVVSLVFALVITIRKTQ